MSNKISQKALKYYKLIMIFVIPVLLFAIVASVVVRNKPEAMKSTLITAALANLVILGFITNTFITLGIEYIRFKNEKDWSNDHKKEIYAIIGKNTFWGIFNFYYLFFIAFLFTDVTGWLAPSLFLDGDYTWEIDWWGVMLSMVLVISVSIFATLLLSQFIKSEVTYGFIGLVYFLGFGYLAGGMFGPGATQWMLWPSLLMPHAYIAHFLGAALTGGEYSIAHLPTAYGVESNLWWTVWENLDKFSFFHLNKNIEQFLELVKSPEFLKSIYVQTNSSIWDMSVMSPWEFISVENIFTGGEAEIYNSFYQLNAMNIFVPLGVSVGCGVTWGYMFYVKK